MNFKTIPALGRIIGKAVIAAALACPVLFTSCAKFAYDDSELKESIKDLNDRLTALEQKMNEQIAALTSLVNSKTTVTEVSTDQSGNTVITLSDGRTITVYPEADIPDLSGLSFITVKQENSVYYWAIGGYGSEPEFLLIDGKKVPVSSATLEGKIEGGKYYVSIDGGKTWVETGIEPKEEVKVFISYDQDEDYVYLTLADGSVIKVAKDKGVSFAILAGKQHFEYGQTKSVKLEMSGVKDYTVTEKPDGWKVAVSGTYLNITAPAEDAVAELEGTIKVLATFAEASPVIARVDVSVSEADFTVSLKGSTVSFILAEKNVDNYDYTGYVYGVATKAEFSLDYAVDYFNNNTRIQTNYDSMTTTIEKLLGESYNPDESYVVFASNYKDSYWDASYSASDIQFVTYSPLKVNVIITPTLDNANVKVTFSGCDGFYAGLQVKQYFVAEDVLYDLGSDWGPSLCTTSYDGPAGLICGGYMGTLQQATEYVLWLVPFDESGEYTVESCRIYEFSTSSISLGGSLAAPSIKLTQDPTFDQVAAEITTVSGAYRTYAKIFTKDEVPSDELELVKKIISGQSADSSASSFRTNRTWLNPGTEVVVAAVAVSEDGKAGQIAKYETATKSLAFSDALKVTAEVKSVGMTNASVKLTFEGNPSTIRYVNTYDTYGLDDIENQLAMEGRWDIQTVEIASLTDNTVELTGLTLSKEYSFFVIALDAEGNMSHMAKATYTPSSDIVYIKKSKEDWAFGQPSINNEVWGDDAWVYVENSWVPSRSGWYPQSTDLTVDLTMPAECKKVYVLVDQPEYHTTKSELQMSDWVVANGTVYTESGKVSNEYVNESTHIYIVWVDSNDKHHTFYEYVPTFPEQPTGKPEQGE